MLLDAKYLRETIYKQRYGENKLKKRIAYRKAPGWPLWPGDAEEAAE